MELGFNDSFETLLRTILECEAGCGAVSNASVFSGHSGPNDTYATGDSRRITDVPKRRKKKRKK